ncbi:MAG: restriction endonuclease fold toxin 5 domain-containing protein [Propionibacteriaceae bacterium]|nr:restriction endonuclease fold toxin 5 domain-containing protein [Propionibacteriaceae bacterium]
MKGDSILEYHLDYTPAKPGDQPFVDYDGHTWRDDPTTGERQEVYLEAKDGYRDHIVNCSEAEADVYLKRFIRQAKRQLDAIEQSGSSARLEWHFSDPDVADSVREAFAAVGEQDAAVKNVLVYYTPKVRR